MAFVVIFSFAYIVGNILHPNYYAILNPFPIGSDTLSHVSKIVYMKEYWAFGWHFKEGMGYPYLTLYSPMAYYLAFLLSFLPLEIFPIVNLLAFAAIVVSAFGIYAFVAVRFNDALMALTSALVYLIARTAATLDKCSVVLSEE